MLKSARTALCAGSMLGSLRVAAQLSTGLSAKPRMPVALAVAIRRTLDAESIHVTMRSIIASKTQRSALDYESPDREESLPRLTIIGGRRFGAAITIGSNLYIRFPGSRRYIQSTIAKGSVKPFITNIVFYPLVFAERASEFSGRHGRFEFRGNDFAGTISVVRGFVSEAKDTHSIWLKHRMIGKQYDDYKFSVDVPIEPIVPPPASAVSEAHPS